MAENITDLVIQLAKARHMKADVANSLDIIRGLFEIQNARLIGNHKTACSIVSDLEAKLRQAAVEHYTETADKKPVAGIPERREDLDLYDAEKALEWAKDHRVALIPESLDVKAFEKIHKAIPFDFVTESEKPVAYISSDLSFALEPLHIESQEEAA